MTLSGLLEHDDVGDAYSSGTDSTSRALFRLLPES